MIHVEELLGKKKANFSFKQLFKPIRFLVHNQLKVYCFKSAILSCTGEEVDCPVLSLYLCCFEAMNIV